MARISRALILSLLISSAHAACRLERAAEVPVRVVEGFPIVTASIGLHPVSLLLDTGAEGHLLLPDAVAALRLPVLNGTVPITGTGGTSRPAPVAAIQGLRLGSVTLPLALAPVAALPALPHLNPMLAGLLGAPLLARYDLDLDVAAGRLSLYPAGGCGDAVPALGPRMTVVKLQITPQSEALLRVRVNGVELIALLDTGSRATLLTEAAAQRLGLHAPVSANTATGVDGQRLPVQHVRVREVVVGDDIRRDAPVSIAPLQLKHADMLLGLDYLEQRRVWISYVTQQLAIALPGPLPSAR